NRSRTGIRNRTRAGDCWCGPQRIAPGRAVPGRNLHGIDRGGGVRHRRKRRKSDMINSFVAEMDKLVRRPAMWILVGVWAIAAVAYVYIIPYLSYANPTSKVSA